MGAKADYDYVLFDITGENLKKYIRQIENENSALLEQAKNNHIFIGLEKATSSHMGYEENRDLYACYIVHDIFGRSWLGVAEKKDLLNCTDVSKLEALLSQYNYGMKRMIDFFCKQ